MSRGLQAEDTAPQRASSDPERPESSPAGAQPGIEDQRLNTGGYRVSLPMFEGPLDLLLHLVQKHELDILNIPISFITEKYVEYIQLLDALNIDLASEYLVMAATLVHIKSRMLLPNPPEDESGDGTEEDELDPRAELVRRLLEYQKYKLAAEQLGGRSILGRDVFPRGSSDQVAGGEAPLEGLASFKLLDAFQAVLERTKKTRDHQIDFERFSLSDKISELSELLQRARRLVFHELFAERASRAELIITFLALLEMTRLRLTRLRQDGPLEPIYIELTVSDDAFPTDEEVLTVGTADDVAGAEVLPVDDAVDDTERIGAAVEDLALEDLSIDDAALEVDLSMDAAADVETTEDAAEDLTTEDTGWADTAADVAATEIVATEITDDELELQAAVLADDSADVSEAGSILPIDPAQSMGTVPAELAVGAAAPERTAPIDTADVAVIESAQAELTTDDAALEVDLSMDAAADVETTDDPQAVGATAVAALGLPEPPAHDDAPPMDHENAPPIDTAAADAATDDAPPDALEHRAEEPEPRLAADPREYE